ncbi:unnamed protein product [Cuscuta campestris]|uniref:Oleosin n=2 Tax=Cuscuta sect. Cleistogrammica TaxID=1824901 RepID=A0A484NJL0_9ASTE|nr:hypothetical protein DM860_012011 [Cuscuta australis]VFR00539.1 unnamed protein product [Cuscuta campestris]
MAASMTTTQQQPGRNDQKLSYQVAKTATAATVGGSLMALSGITLVATIIGLVIATPLLLIFSPVLIPAALTAFLILAGLFASAAFLATSAFIFYWMYMYIAGKHPVGEDKINYMKEKLAVAAQGFKEKAAELGSKGQQQIKGTVQEST